MTTFAVTSVNSLLCHASTCFRIGSKFRCTRSTPIEMQSTSEHFECFASTGVNTPVAMSPNPGCREVVQLSASLLDGLLGYPPEDRSQRRSRTGEMFLGDSCSGLGILCGYLAGRTGRKRNLGQP